MKNRIFATIALSFLAGSVVAATEAEYKAAVADAKAEQKKAAELRHEWTTVAKFLKSADKAAKAGKFEQAVSLAQKAKQHAELGQFQAQEQKDAGPRF